MNSISMDGGSGKAERFSVPVVLVLILSWLLLPLLGAWLVGRPLAVYLRFPPLTRYVEHASWNGMVFGAGVLVLLPVMVWMAATLDFRPARGRSSGKLYPWWAWIGLALLAVSWLLAWNRFSWFRAWQPYTFTPLWLGYILVVNGLARWRTGSCLLERNVRGFLLLFPASSLFWWYFEYLNRFVQNWYYLGIEDFSAKGYVLHATICFSTVLPAVAGTREALSGWLETRTPASAQTFRSRRWAGWTILVGSGSGLAGIALWPDILFPLVWVAPFAMILGMQLVRRHRLCTLMNGPWPVLVLPALAGLVCGLFWEMWNWKSLAHWEYSIPWVDRYHLFAMPLLGYGGYLPFGIGCCCLAELVAGREENTMFSLALHRVMG